MFKFKIIEIVINNLNVLLHICSWTQCWNIFHRPFYLSCVRITARVGLRTERLGRRAKLVCVFYKMHLRCDTYTKILKNMN